MMLTAWCAATPFTLVLGEQCPSPAKSWEEKVDLPCRQGPGGREARAMGTLGTWPLTRLGRAQLTCSDLSRLIAIFRRTGKILRDSELEAYRLNLRVVQEAQTHYYSCGNHVPFRDVLPLPGILRTQSIILNPTAASTAGLRGFAPLHTLQKAASPTHQLGHESDETK